MKTIALILLFFATLNAHSLKVFADIDGDFVVIKSYFYGNSPCKGCKVDIIKDKKVIQNTTTDENGIARVKLLANEFEILVDGSLAHEKKITFTTDKEIIENKEDSTLVYILKIVGSIAGIIIFFGFLYLIKRR